jgi:two-component system, OmpR family, phosphate regulon sensor histidine kinase PhoR
MANERVLVVDDSLVYQDIIINHILKPYGYKPLATRDGDEGLQIVLHEAPDLIILDQQLPGLTGLELLKALHEEENEVPVIMTTIYGSEEVAVNAFRLGVRDYVIKPFEIEEMLEAIDRALAEERLRREKDALVQELMGAHMRLEAVLTHTADAVVLVNEEDRVLLINKAACEAFGVKGDATWRPMEKAIKDELLKNTFYRAKALAKSTRAEITLPNDRTLNAHVTPIPGVGRVAVMQDITHLKELDRMKSEFVATVSHDLRSPLTSIRGFADLLPAAGPLNEQQMEFLNKIQRSVATITELISDLLDLGRIEAGVRMDMEACYWEDIIEKVVIDLQSQADHKEQIIHQQIEPDLLPVRGNPLRLEQAVSNLLGNAVKYTPERGEITISASSEGDQIAVTVKDDGIGIPPKDLPHIFEKFYRVDSPETKDIAGSGLGLSIVKTIVEKHQGRIWVDSQLDQGSEFTFMLPATDPSELEAAPEDK